MRGMTVDTPIFDELRKFTGEGTFVKKRWHTDESPYNTPNFKKNRAKAKRAKQSRKMNRGR